MYIAAGSWAARRPCYLKITDILYRIHDSHVYGASECSILHVFPNVNMTTPKHINMIVNAHLLAAVGELSHFKHQKDVISGASVFNYQSNVLILSYINKLIDLTRKWYNPDNEGLQNVTWECIWIRSVSILIYLNSNLNFYY